MCLATSKSLIIPIALLLAFILTFFILRMNGGKTRPLKTLVEAVGILVFTMLILSPRLTTILSIGVFKEIDPTFDLAIKPNIDMTFSSDGKLPDYRVKTNTRGFRDEEWPGPDDGKRRIMLVGDSFIFGAGVQQEELLARRLESKLKNRQPSVRVYSVGQPGWNLMQEVEAIQTLNDLLRPDIVLISHLPGNDLWPTDPLFTRSRDDSLEFEAAVNLRKQQVARWDGREYDLPELLDPYLKALETLRNWAETHRIDVLIYTHGPSPHRLEPLESSPYVFVRCFPDWQNDPTNFYVGDGHPTPKGNRFLAELLAPFVKKLLELRESPPEHPEATRQELKKLWQGPCLPNLPVNPAENWIIPAGRETPIQAFFNADWLLDFGGKVRRITVQKTQVEAEIVTSHGPRTATLKHDCPDEETCQICPNGCLCLDRLSPKEKSDLERACPSFPQNLWIENKK